MWQLLPSALSCLGQCLVGKRQVSLELPQAQGAQSFSWRDLSETDLEGRQARSLTDTWPSRAGVRGKAIF